MLEDRIKDLAKSLVDGFSAIATIAGQEDRNAVVDEVELLGKFRVVRDGEVGFAELPIGLLKFNDGKITLLKIPLKR